MKITFVSSNIHKFQEIEEILAGFNLEINFHKADIPEIQADSLENIALFSGNHAYSLLKRPLFVEDTGLFIDALNGFPGPYASYVFRTIGNSGILQLLEGTTDRSAVFKTAIALILSETESMIFLGATMGTIASSERGKNGWGYDPIFIPIEGDGQTYGEMTVTNKNKISHRRRSVEQLADYLKKNG